MSRRHRATTIVPSSGGGGGAGVAMADRNVVYKAMQIAGPEASFKPTIAELTDANVSGVRVILHWASNIANTAAFVQDIIDAGIFPVICIGQKVPGPMTRAEWEDRIRDACNAIPCGMFEPFNEPFVTYSYDGVSANWGGFFRAMEHAGTIFKDEYDVPWIMGGPEDQDTDNIFQLARTRWGGTDLSGWPKGIKGCAIHCYGQGPGIGGTINDIETRARGATALGGNLRSLLPLWITEMGWGAGGNSQATLSADPDQDLRWIRPNDTPPPPTLNSPVVAVAPNSGGQQNITGANFTLNVQSTTGGWDASGGIFLRSVAATGTSFNPANPYPFDQNRCDSRVITYTSKTNTQFRGCNMIGTPLPYERINQGQTLDKWVDGGDLNLPSVTNSDNRRTSQASLIQQIYNTLYISDRTKISDLNVKFVGYFIFHDYVGHKGPNDGTSRPANWAELAGLRDWNNVPRPALATFRNIVKERTRLP